jgi:hypothetical protein
MIAGNGGHTVTARQHRLCFSQHGAAAVNDNYVLTERRVQMPIFRVGIVKYLSKETQCDAVAAGKRKLSADIEGGMKGAEKTAVETTETNVPELGDCLSDQSMPDRWRPPAFYE